MKHLDPYSVYDMHKKKSLTFWELERVLKPVDGGLMLLFSFDRKFKSINLRSNNDANINIVQGDVLTKIGNNPVDSIESFLNAIEMLQDSQSSRITVGGVGNFTLSVHAVTFVKDDGTVVEVKSTGDIEREIFQHAKDIAFSKRNKLDTYNNNKALDSLLDYHDKEWFEERINDYFIVKTIVTNVQRLNPKYLNTDQNKRQFVFTDGSVASSVKCCSLTELKGTSVVYLKNGSTRNGQLTGIGQKGTSEIEVSPGVFVSTSDIVEIL